MALVKKEVSRIITLSANIPNSTTNVPITGLGVFLFPFQKLVKLKRVYANLDRQTSCSVILGLLDLNGNPLQTISMNQVSGSMANSTPMISAISSESFWADNLMIGGIDVASLSVAAFTTPFNFYLTLEIIEEVLVEEILS